MTAAEADQRRKGDAGAKDIVVAELASMRKELQQRLELEIATVKQDIEGARESVESNLRHEAAAQHQALAIKRQAMKEELTLDFTAIVQQVWTLATHPPFAAHVALFEDLCQMSTHRSL